MVVRIIGTVVCLGMSFSTANAAAASMTTEALAAIKARTAQLVAQAAPFDAAAVDLPAMIWPATDMPVSFQDVAGAPSMVVVPAGEFTRGSVESEANRMPNEGPRGRVRIAHAFAVSKYPVTVGEFARFIKATRRAVPEDCWTMEDGIRDTREGRSWKAPGFPQTERSPVVCIRWEDARAYAVWLARKTGQPYRLLSDSEFEYVNRAGTTTRFWWGDTVGEGHSNCVGCGSRWDGRQTSPVGSFAPNGFGLYDTTGNVWSWLGDCGSASYEGVANDGSPRSTVNCDTPSLRGGSWDTGPEFLRSAMRAAYPSGNHFSIGFRVARGL